jgi:hypothetical protein
VLPRPGAITTSTDTIADCLPVPRFYGSPDKVTYEQVGYNSRLDSLAVFEKVVRARLDNAAIGEGVAIGVQVKVDVLTALGVRSCPARRPTPQGVEAQVTLRRNSVAA